VTTGPVDPIAAVPGRLRASDADREQVIDTIKAAFVQGRLTKDELDLRAGQALTARTYAELVATTAAMPAGLAAARPASQTRPPRETGPARGTRPRRKPARVRDGPPSNHMALKWGLGLGTIVLPAMIAATLHTKNQNLFSGTVVLLIAYFLALLVAMANSVASRYENESSGEIPGSRRVTD
jgi:DUF1707 SHOCT-like domain